MVIDIAEIIIPKGLVSFPHPKGHFSEGCGHDINSLISHEISAGEVLSLGAFFKYVIGEVNQVGHIFYVFFFFFFLFG